MRGTRRTFASSSGVMGRASGSAHAAASISASVIGVGAGIGIISSVPSGLTRTSVPSRRILAIVVVMFVPRCLSSGDDADALASLCVNDGQQLALAHAREDDPFLAIGFPQVQPLDREQVADSQGCLLEAHAMNAEVFGRL